MAAGYVAPGYKPLTAIADKMYTPDTPEQIREAAIAKAIAEGGVPASDWSPGDADETANIGMRSNMDEVGGGPNRGQFGVYGPGKIHRDPSGKNTLLAQLIDNSMQGVLNPMATSEEPVAEPEQNPLNPMLEALIPHLVIGGKPISETLLKDSPFNKDREVPWS